MDDIQLGQTLLVKPDVPFKEISAVLSKLGWQQQQAAQTPLVEDEPEFSSWSWQGHKPFVIYTFNPVVNMRVLDVATLPPVMRGAIAEQLPILKDREIDDLLFSSVPRNRLLGLWAAQETERLDLIPQTTRLSHDPDRIVAEQARLVAERFEKILASREALMVNLRLLAEAAEEVIRRLDDPAITQSLKPSHAELVKLFDPSFADDLMMEIDNDYHRPPIAAPGDGYPQLIVTAANAGLLRWPNELSDAFPRGYRNIAGWMEPKWIWLSWRWQNEKGGSVQFDGLVWVETRWVWLPKVFRIISTLLQRASAGVAIH